MKLLINVNIFKGIICVFGDKLISYRVIIFGSIF